MGSGNTAIDTSQDNTNLVKNYLLNCDFLRMCLYLFSKAHTGIITSDLKKSNNIMGQLNCCIDVQSIGVNENETAVAWLTSF